jgi:hypothetical protein
MAVSENTIPTELKENAVPGKSTTVSTTSTTVTEGPRHLTAAAPLPPSSTKAKDNTQAARSVTIYTARSSPSTEPTATTSADAAAAMTMGELGPPTLAVGDVGPPKDLLRERIRNKRAHEGLEDISSEELFAKKPKYDVSKSYYK